MANIVILGAGKPNNYGVMSPLILVDGKTRILDCILSSYRSIGDPRFQFVGGYQFEKIVDAYPDLPFVLNNEWRASGSLSSFLLADYDVSSDCFVTYSDIVYPSSIVDSMNENRADAVLCVDTNWKKRYTERSDSDVNSAERILVEEGKFKEITTDASAMGVTFEFCGLVKFSPRALSFLKENTTLLQTESRKLSFFHAVNLLSENSFTIDMLDVKNEWAELNQPADLAQYVLGTKAETLTRLKPLVKRGLIGNCEYFAYKDWTASSEKIIEKIQEFSEGGLLIIRSSALSEDQSGQSNAGKYESILNINPLDRDELTSSIDRVFASYTSPQPDDQLLVQTMIRDVKVSGVVMTRTLDYGSPYYVVNYDISSFTDAVTSGRRADLQTIFVSRDSNHEELSCEPFVKSILSAVQEIEDLLCDDSLDIEFAVTEDNKVHIFQVRPIVAKAGFRVVSDSKVFDVISSIKKQIEHLQSPPPPLLGRRTVLGRMPDWNPAEIIGAKPNDLAKSLYEFLILDDIWAQQRSEYGYRDVRPTSLLRNLFGHVFVDVRASFNSFIPKKLDADLACRLVEHYLDELESHPESHDKVEFDILYTCYDFDLRDRLTSLSASGKFTSEEVTLLYTELVKITIEQLPSSCRHIATVDGLTSKIVEITASRLPPIEKVRLLLHHTKEMGTLPFAHLARNGFVATSLLRSLVRQDVITNEEINGFYESLNTITNQMEMDGYLYSAGTMTKDQYLSKYGHLRPGTYEISVPTYGQNFDSYLSELDSGTLEKPSKPKGGGWSRKNITEISGSLKDSPLPWTFEEFDRFLREAIAGREYAKLKFSKSLSISLDIIQAWGEGHGLSTSDLSNLNINEILRNCSNITFVAGPDMYENRIAEEESKKEISKLLEFPNLIFSPDQIDCHYRQQDEPNFITAKNLTGELVIVSQRDTTGGNLDGAIVLIEQADPGYDWLFSKNIGGLITKYGGSNSHMAIRCAELSLPAAIGVGDVLYKRLSLAKKVTLDCHNQKIETLS
jgi:glutamine kinase